MDYWDLAEFYVEKEDRKKGGNRRRGIIKRAGTTDGIV
jgi:hypothetical protein